MMAGARRRPWTGGVGVNRERVRQELRRQPRWVLWVLLASTVCTVASLLLGGRDNSLGGPVLYFVVLCGSGALLLLCVVALLVRGRAGAGDR
jgi:hypothetical protein